MRCDEHLRQNAPEVANRSHSLPDCSFDMPCRAAGIYSVKRLFTEGRELPNWRLSVVRGIPARLIIRNDTHDGENLRSRRTLRATLFDPASGQPIPEFPTMYDVQLLSMTSDELVLT